MDDANLFVGFFGNVEVVGLEIEHSFGFELCILFEQESTAIGGTDGVEDSSIELTLELVERREFRSGVTVQRYRPAA